MRFFVNFLIYALVFNLVFPIFTFGQLGKPFPKEGALPFESIAVEQKIDKQCGPAGASKESVKMAQNKAKNNFWETNEPVSINFNIFKQMENETDKKISSGEIGIKVLTEHSAKKVYPSNRAELAVKINGESYSEGTVVTLEAYIIDSHYSNTEFNDYGNGDKGTGEAVNCNQAWLRWNDIHIVLGEKKTSKKCDTVTAEISPHFRPETWARFHDGINKEINKRIKGLPIRGKKVRLTGTLFYDASHKGCKDGKSQGSPVRLTVWEIHPVYRIQILDAAANKWFELDEWAKTH